MSMHLVRLEQGCAKSLADFKLACSVYMSLASLSALVLSTLLKAVLKDVIHSMDLRTYVFLMYYVTLSRRNLEENITVNNVN